MILVSRGSVGACCVVRSASSRSAWYALLTVMWWTHTCNFTAVGLVRTTVYGPFQCGAKESCFQALTTPDPRAQICESVPQGGMAPFLVQTSVQFSRSVMSDSLQLHESQHARPPCPSPTPGVHSDSVHRVSDAIQPSHPLSSPSPPAPNPSQHQSLFQ